MIGRSLLGSVLLLLVTAQACRADLKCYICSDCAKVDPATTELQSCDESFFNAGGSTEASTATTEPVPEPEPSSTTVETSTGSEETTISTTDSTTASTSSTSGAPPPPTPQTAGPVPTTTGLPTPPEENLAIVTEALTQVENDSTTTPLAIGSNSTELPLATTQATVLIPQNFSQFNVRSRRALDDYSYHCYKVNQIVNGSVQTERGCSRVTSNQGVCQQLKLQNDNIELKSCNPCSMNKCNGSSALQVSLLTLLLAAIAGLLQRN